MALSFLFDPNKQFQSIGGVNEVGGFLRVFLNGTDDRATTYKNFDGTLNEADIVLDTYGRAVVIVDDTKTYRIEVYNRLGGLMWTVSNYKASGGSGGGSGTPVIVEGTADEIDVTENSEGGIKYFIVSLSQVFKNTIATIQSSMSYIASAVNGKKDKQTAASYVGSATQTIVGVTQDENGEINAVFEDIEFPDYSQRFEDIENEQAVDAKVIAAALNDLNSRMESVEGAQNEKNIGDRTADSLDAQVLMVGGIPVKFRQSEKSLDGATDKTVTNISQDENGVITVTYSAIAFPDWTSAITAATDLCEKLANKKTTFTGNTSSDTYYPTIKAVVDYLDSRLQNLGGKKITNNGAPFTAASQLPTTTPYYGQNINSDDYAYVQDTGLASRYTAIVTESSVAWSIDYEIALPVFTAGQQAAIDSGANSTKIGNYDSHLVNTSNPHGVTYSQVGASPDTHTHQVVINGVTKTIDKTGGTPVDLGTYITNHQDLSNYLTKTGDGSDVTASFTTADSRNNISTGEKLSVIFGKIAKWFGDLKAVAFSGSYNDLSDKPTIPTVNNGTLTIYRNGVSQGTFSANQSGLTGIDISVPTKTSQLVNDSFATVATSGSYNDLSNKPTIPTVNNGTLTIKQNNSVVGTFTANQSNNVDINLTNTTYGSLTPSPASDSVSLCTRGEKFTWGTTGSQLQVARESKAARYIDIGTLHNMVPANDVEGVAHFTIVGKLSTWANENNSVQFRADVCVEFRSRAGYGDFEPSRIYGRILYKGNSSQLSNITVVTTEVSHPGAYNHYDLVISLSIPNASNNYTRIAVESFYAMNDYVGQVDGIAMEYTRDITIHDSVPTGRESNQSYELSTL